MEAIRSVNTVARDLDARIVEAVRSANIIACVTTIRIVEVDRSVDTAAEDTTVRHARHVECQESQLDRVVAIQLTLSGNEFKIL